MTLYRKIAHRMKKYIIAIPQNKEMEEKYQNGWEIENSIIEKFNLKEDEFFEVYVESHTKTEYLSLSEEVFKELTMYGVWESINHIDPNTLIDTYEEAEIREKEKLLEVQSFLDTIKEDFSNETMAVVEKIILLIKNALQHDVGIYFFLGLD